jgi:hypothetical protein
MGGSQVFLKSGEAFPVEDMMAALLIGSANDAAVALAERLGGSVPGALHRMNERAAALGLSRTRFASVHGLPPGAGQEGDISTPRDMARLSQELVKFPDILRWTSTEEAPFRQGAFILRNSNQLRSLSRRMAEDGPYPEAGEPCHGEAGDAPPHHRRDGGAQQSGAIRRGGATPGGGVQPVRPGHGGESRPARDAGDSSSPRQWSPPSRSHWRSADRREARGTGGGPDDCRGATGPAGSGRKGAAGGHLVARIEIERSPGFRGAGAEVDDTFWWLTPWR